MNKIALGRLKEVKEPGETQNINIVQYISTEEYEQLSTAISSINTFLSDTELYGIVVRNFAEYFNTVKIIGKAIKIKDMNFLKSTPALEEINRRVLNFLSSFRSYLDFMETRLNRDFTDNEKLLKSFLAFCSHEFDNNFAYRFIYRLRNFCQHCGFPIKRLDFENMPDQTGKLIYKFNPIVEKGFLINNFDWKKLRPEIEALESEFDPGSVFASAMLSLKTIHSNITKLLFDEIRPKALVILDYAKRIEGHEGIPAIFFVETTHGDIRTVSQVTSKDFPVDVAQKIADKDFKALFPDAEI